MNEYAGFKVLLDDPAQIPGLGFQDYADALAEMIIDSKAEFAVGIFGSWGSGKTTLMRLIERVLSTNADLVTVWFTAWRYAQVYLSDRPTGHDTRARYLPLTGGEPSM